MEVGSQVEDTMAAAQRVMEAVAMAVAQTEEQRAVAPTGELRAMAATLGVPWAAVAMAEAATAEGAELEEGGSEGAIT